SVEGVGHQVHERASLRRTDDRQLIVGDAARLLQHLVQQLGGADELLHVVHVPERLVNPLHDPALDLAQVHDVQLLLLDLGQPVTALQDVTNALRRLCGRHAVGFPDLLGGIPLASHLQHSRVERILLDLLRLGQRGTGLYGYVLGLLDVRAHISSYNKKLPRHCINDEGVPFSEGQFCTSVLRESGLKPDLSRPAGATTTGACRCRFRSSGSRSSTVRNSNGTCFRERYRTVASHWTHASFLYTMVTGSSNLQSRQRER